MRRNYTPLASVQMLSMAALCSASFSDSFDVNSAANWTINKSGNLAGNTADVFFTTARWASLRPPVRPVAPHAASSCGQTEPVASSAD